MLQHAITGALACTFVGALAWMFVYTRNRSNVALPLAVVDATLASFLRDCVITAEGQSVDARTVYAAYAAHCRANALNPIFETAFARRMRPRFDHVRGRVVKYLNVRLRETAPLTCNHDGVNTENLPDAS